MINNTSPLSIKTLPKILVLMIVTVYLVACDEANKDDKSQTTKPVKTESQRLNINPKAISLNNQGVGEMGSFDYEKATKTFESLLKIQPNWSLAQQNLAIALLNRQKPNDEEQSLAIAKKILAADNTNLVAKYIIGILNFNQGQCHLALPEFNAIAKADKSDAYALYFAGQCQLQNGDVEQALSLYQQAIKADSYLRSAYYGSFMAAQRLQKSELAKEMLNAYQKLSSNPKARLAEIKYTRMGPKANAQAYLTETDRSKVVQKKNPPYFKPSLPLDLIAIENIQQFGMVNLNQTQLPQLYTVSNNQLRIVDNFLTTPQIMDNLSLSLTSGNHLLAWGDINNDNKIDVYITGQNDQLYLQTDQGFSSVDMQEYGFGSIASSAVRLADADHDGDLDVLLLSKSGDFELWNNNLNGTFIALSSKMSLTTDSGYKQILLEDIDADRDVDIVLVGNNKLSILFNDRMWDYKLKDLIFDDSKIINASLSDNDSNGLIELNVLLKNGEIQSFEYENAIAALKKIQQFHVSSASAMQQADINADGNQEFIVKSNDGIKILDSQGKTIEQILLNDIQNFKVLNSVQGPELLLQRANILQYVPASKNRGQYLLLNVSGKEDDANSVRSNFSGIGSRFVVHNQAFYAIASSFQNMNGIDQDYQAINIATGNNPLIDFIEIEWSDGVYQTELGLPANSFQKITETQRQLSSCPVIFAWNKGKYQFISDVLGVGGIGFALGRNEYGVPRPWENYLLSDKQLSSDNGLFKLQFTEPMEESAYLDKLSIQAIDVPKQWSVILDERMQISEPQVTGKPLFYQSIVHPINITDSFGNNVTQLALKTDKKAIEIINQDKRFMGLIDEQILTLEFADDLAGDYQLMMNGWVEYGYSQTMFAAWQAGKTAHAPSLEYQVDGQWKILLKEFGYPAGMPRMASVPIHLPEKTRKLRIRTNMEVYFDELAVIQTQQPDTVISHTLELESAKLKQLGFPQRQNNLQRVPSYDFNKIQPFWDTRYMQGAYTQLGEIKELVNKQDNALAIIGAGEGIEFEFKDNLPALADTFNRYYILQFKGWAKDMDILTKEGETLAPLPKNGKVSARAIYLNNKYNTRFKAGK